MKLTVISSSSKGNGYVLETSKGEQLVIETGRPLSEFRKIAKLKTSECVGAIISHLHSDHCKYTNYFTKAGIGVYSTPHVSSIYPNVKGLKPGETYQIGEFRVTPIPVLHDVPCYSYLIYHKEMGTLYFFTDCYSMNAYITGINYFMCECNYEDGMLEKAVKEGKVSMKQADRIRLSHLSEKHAIEYLQKCKSEDSTRKILLIHGSPRHLVPEQAVSKFQQVLGIATYYAEPKLKIEL